MSALSASAQIPEQPQFPQDTLFQRDTVNQDMFRMPGDTTRGTRGKGRGRLDQLPDSLMEYDDSTGAEDTTWVVCLDSTARLSQFVHSRTDPPMVLSFRRENYSLYLEASPQIYKREVKLDTLGEFITIRETVNGLDVKVPIKLSLEEYIQRRFEYERINSWRMMTGQTEIKKAKDGLSELMGSITNISIPIPANPLMNIFGGDKVDLRISGDVNIRAAFRNTSTDQSTLSRYDQSRNEPTFKQDVRINVNGLIGKKLNISADWNTQRTFEYENQLKIKYTGFDDEIIQSVEAGNVSLQAPSLVGGGQALFGIKAKMQMGPLTLTTLLSQKKGQTKEFTVSGGSQASEVTIYPYDYSRNHFFLDTLYKQFFEILKNDQVPQITPDIDAFQVIQLDVYISVAAAAAEQAGTGVKAAAYIDLPFHGLDELYDSDELGYLAKQTDRYFEGVFVRLDPNKDFKFDQFGGYLTLLTSFNDDQVIAVEYEIAGIGGVSRFYGGLAEGNDSVRFLKLVKPKNLYNNPNYIPAWELLMKNFYSVRATNIKKGNFGFEIWRQTQGAEIDEVENEKLLQVFGLDRFDSTSGARTPDSGFDFLPGFTVDVDRGEIIFPTLRPFDEGIKKYFAVKDKEVNDSLLFSDIYDTTSSAAQKNSLKNKYFFKVRAAGAQSSRYQLGYNVVEGSVQVLLNGSPLRVGEDYSVDYMLGEVILKNPRAMDPGQNVSVKYEQNDLFQIAAKTLIGARGELATFPNTNIGFTIMNLNQETLSDKVRIGEEPTNNMMLGVDASTSQEIPFLTDMIDALPFIRTNEMSTIKFGGEAAFMFPDANTKKSTIAGDRGASIAYLDDFEGSRRTVPINIQYPAWALASTPEYFPLGSDLHDSVKNASRARLAWYNIPQGATVQDIWPNRRTRPGDNLLNPFILDYNPNHRGLYNYSLNLDSTLHREFIGGSSGNYDNETERRKNWNGIMRSIGSTAGSILEQNITYIEFWMKATSADINDLRRGKLYVDLGYISEDILSNRQLNSEDNVRTPSNPSGITNGVLNPGEDLGIDMLGNAEEISKYQNFITRNSGDPDVDPGDPAGDDYSFCMPDNPGCTMFRINGTENNGLAEGNNYPNTEDLNGNGSVDLINEYLEYELPLDTIYVDSLGAIQSNQFHVGGGYKGWYQFRIPLLDATRIIGNSTPQSILQNVQYIRMWLSGFSKPVNIWFAEIDLLGNQWQERTQNDSLLKVSVMSIEENPQYMQEWYELGITRERDKTDPNNIIEANEQSLAFVLNDLPKDTSREVFKVYTIKPVDLINYKSMKMFIHGDKSFEYISADQYDAALYLRFGTDSLNFYEYRAPIHPGWDIANNEMIIDFGELTSVKTTRDTGSSNRIYRVPIPGREGATYGVRGNPSLRQGKEIMIGITNTGKPLLSGEVWVNELRLVEVDNSSGSAFRFDTQLKLADFGSFGFNYAQTDPNYHTLEQRFGNQNTNVNWAINSTIAVDRFLPASWQGTQIPVGYSHSEQLVKPKYMPNTDVVVEEAADRAQTTAAADKVINDSQTLSIKDSYSVSGLKIVPPVNAWYVRDTFSKLVFSFNYNTASERNPSFEVRKSWQWNLGINYGLTLPTTYYFQPFKKLFKGVFVLEDYKDWKIYYVPLSSISAGISGNRSRSMEKGRTQSSILRDIRNFGARKNFGFAWRLTEGGLTNLSGDYGLSLDRNLQELDNDTVGRDFWSLMKSMFIKGKDGRYGQRFTINTKPKIPNILDIPKYFELTMGYSVQYSWQNNFQKAGISAGYSNGINFSMNFRLKALTDPWFETKKSAPPPKAGAAARPRPGVDSAGQKDAKEKPAVKDTSKPISIFGQLKSIARLAIKIPILDFENINIGYSQSNRASAGAIVGSTGFMNFWGRLPFQGSETEYGPSRLFQLGLINDPDGVLKFSPKSRFPFVGWRTELGLRYPNMALINDQYSQDNKITIRTKRPLWKNADLELNWNVGWKYSRTSPRSTDSLGRQTVGEPTISGGVERSFLTIPPVFLFKSLKSGLEDVGKKYEELSQTETPNKALVRAFEEGLETLPLLNKLFGQYAPRPNWTFRWSGIERIGGLNSVFERLSLEHNYSSSISRDFRSSPSKGEQTDAEQIKYGFSPLAGINMTFKKLLKGNFSGTFKYNTTTSYTLNVATQTPNIMSTLSQEMSLTLSYSRRGFSIPLFGLDLSNDIEVSMNFSYTKNSRRRYEPELLSINQEGIPMEGQTRTRLEPRIRYVLSSRVTASLFYTYVRTAPDAAGSTVIGTTSNEAGLDIHISIGG